MEYVSPYAEVPAERLKCDFCETTFSSQAAKRRHMRAHTGEKRHVCPLCEEKFARADYLQKHWRIHQEDLGENDDTMPLRLASDAATLVGDGRPHRPQARNDHGLPVASSPEKESEADDGVALALARASREARFLCEHCGKTFEWFSAKQRHVRSHFAVKEHFCHFQDCNATFVRHDHLINHVNKIHDPSEWTEEARAAQEAAERAYQNPTLDEDAKPEPLPLPGHGVGGKYHVEELTCHICGLKLSQPSAKRRHIATVHAEDRPWVCSAPGCGARFPVREYVSRHERIVHNIYEGPEARHQAADANFLARELARQRHSMAASAVRTVAAPEQTEVVPIDTNSSAAEAAVTARQDLVVVDQDKRWSPRMCRICYKRFHSASHLRRHMSFSHNPEMPFECDVPGCGKRLSRKDNLLAHKRLHESGRLVVRAFPTSASNSDSEQSEDTDTSEQDDHTSGCPDLDFEAQLLAAANGEFTDATNIQQPSADSRDRDRGAVPDVRPLSPNGSHVQKSVRKPQYSTHVSCQACRQGKRKCSREQPCFSCRVTGRECEYVFVRATNVSCLPCRLQKHKCSQGQPCEYCQRTGRECVYVSKSRPGAEGLPWSTQSEPSNNHIESAVVSSADSLHTVQPKQDGGLQSKQQQTTQANLAAATLCYGCGKVFNSRDTFFQHAPCFTPIKGAQFSAQRQPEHITSAIGSRSAPITVRDIPRSARNTTSSPERHDSGQEGLSKAVPTVSPHFAAISDERAALEVLNTVPSQGVMRVLLGIAQKRPECRPIHPDELQGIIRGRSMVQGKTEPVQSHGEAVKPSITEQMKQMTRVLTFENAKRKAKRRKVRANANLTTGSGIRLRDVTEEDYETVVMDDYG